MTQCAECDDFTRHVVVARNDYNFLVNRTRSRGPSRAERRLLRRRKTDYHIARELLQNHQAVCLVNPLEAREAT